VLIVVLARTFFGGGGLPSGPATVAGVASVPGQQELRSPPTPTAVVAVCPYCGQSEDRWTALGTVPPPAISGSGAAVIEGACGRMVYGLRANERYPPASIAKIVTALVVAEQASLTDVVDVQVSSWALVVEDGSSVAGLEPGLRVTVRDLLVGLILPSGNDAALALAAHLGGVDRFVGMMNSYATRAGLQNSHFTNPDGRDRPLAYTSALDIGLLGRMLMARPELRAIAGMRTAAAAWDGHTLWNNNYFVYGFPGATGVKFGYTEAALETVVGSASRNGRELYVSVLHSDFAYLDAVKLLDWAYANTKPAC
jgi:D-alanyl-D-alanine carboxypeptidase (penicillin-binding protein 5/6)